MAASPSSTSDARPSPSLRGLSSQPPLIGSEEELALGGNVSVSAAPNISVGERSLFSSEWFHPSTPIGEDGLETLDAEPDWDDLLRGVLPEATNTAVGGESWATIATATSAVDVGLVACQASTVTLNAAIGSDSQSVADATTSTCHPDCRPIGTQTFVCATDGFVAQPSPGD